MNALSVRVPASKELRRVANTTLQVSILDCREVLADLALCNDDRVSQIRDQVKKYLSAVEAEASDRGLVVAA